MKKSILIVDVQCGFINDATSHIPELVESIQSQYEKTYVTRFFNKKNSFFRTLIKWNRFDKNSDDYHLAFKLLPRAVVINKDTYSCVNSAFVKELNKNHIEEIDVCGIDTDICVTKCAVDLFEAGIVPRVLGQYCASHAGFDAHKQALNTLERFIGRGQVIR